jgi:hypothetical protein
LERDALGLGGGDSRNSQQSSEPQNSKKMIRLTSQARG